MVRRILRLLRDPQLFLLTQGLSRILLQHQGNQLPELCGPQRHPKIREILEEHSDPDYHAEECIR
jgi:hypothetical protein